MEKEQRAKIVHKYLENTEASYRSIAKTLKISPSTVMRVIKRYNETLSIERAPGSGQNTPIRKQEAYERVIATTSRNQGLSSRFLAKKFDVSKTTVLRWLKSKGYNSYKAVKVPNRNHKQNKSAKSRARKLYQFLSSHEGCILMDDETYVKLDLQSLPGQKFYFAKNRLKAAEKFRFVKLQKFGKKVLIWQAICGCGLKSAPFVTDKTLNSKLYLEECLQKRLLPLYRSHAKKPLFWPDLASCHYSAVTRAWYLKEKVKFVEKDMNPPNCPELRAIERYWAIIKSMLKKDGRVIKTVQGMRRKWIQTSSKMPSHIVQKLMMSSKKNLRKFVRGKAQ